MVCTTAARDSARRESGPRRVDSVGGTGPERCPGSRSRRTGLLWGVMRARQVVRTAPPPRWRWRVDRDWARTPLHVLPSREYVRYSFFIGLP